MSERMEAPGANYKCPWCGMSFYKGTRKPQPPEVTVNHQGRKNDCLHWGERQYFGERVVISPAPVSPLVTTVVVL